MSQQGNAIFYLFSRLSYKSSEQRKLKNAYLNPNLQSIHRRNGEYKFFIEIYLLLYKGSNLRIEVIKPKERILFKLVIYWLSTITKLKTITKHKPVPHGNSWIWYNRNKKKCTKMLLTSITWNMRHTTKIG